MPRIITLRRTTGAAGKPADMISEAYTNAPCGQLHDRRAKPALNDPPAGINANTGQTAPLGKAENSVVFESRVELPFVVAHRGVLPRLS